MMKTLLALIGCGLVAAIAADESASAPRGCCPPERWCGVEFETHGSWLYLQPEGSDLYYAAVAIALDPSLAIPAISPNWEIKEITPHYHSGFEVGVGTLFSSTKINITLDWERLRTHDKSSFTVETFPGNMVGPLFDIGPNSTVYQNAQGKTSSNFDEVHLNFGKKLCFFNRLYTTFGAGVAYTRIKQTLASNYSNFADTISRSVSTYSTFSGGGPQIAADYNYRMFDDFFFIGNTSISLFVGEMKNRTTFNSFTPELALLGIPQPNVQHTNVPHRTQVVPGFEQKLGISYLAECSCATVRFEIGYQCQIYLDAIQTIDMTAPQVLPSLAPFTPAVGVFAVGFERTLSNYMLSGPYVTLGVEF